MWAGMSVLPVRYVGIGPCRPAVGSLAGLSWAPVRPVMGQPFGQTGPLVSPRHAGLVGHSSWPGGVLTRRLDVLPGESGVVR